MAGLNIEIRMLAIIRPYFTKDSRENTVPKPHINIRTKSTCSDDDIGKFYEQLEQAMA